MFFTGALRPGWRQHWYSEHKSVQYSGLDKFYFAPNPDFDALADSKPRDRTIIIIVTTPHTKSIHQH